MSFKTTMADTTLIPSKEAAKLSGYSNDYVSRLARSGKVVAVLTNRQWFVDVDSLTNYIEESKREKEIRNKKLSEARRIEQSELTTVPFKNPTLSLEEEIVLPSPISSMVRAGALLLCASLVVTALWFPTQTDYFSSGSFVATVPRAADTIVDERGLLRVVEAELNGLLAWVLSAVSLPQDAELTRNDGHVVEVYRDRESSQLLEITAPPNEANEADETMARRIQLHLSDAVVVETSATSTGLITPQFRSEANQPYRYSITEESAARDVVLPVLPLTPS